VTGTLFSYQNAVKLMLDTLYKGTPLAQTMQSMDSMMGALQRMGRLFIQYHPNTNVNGERSLDIRPVFNFFSEHQVNPFHFVSIHS
jgi:hypothetical protein